MTDRDDGTDDLDLVRELVAANPDGLWIFDDDGVTTDANVLEVRSAEIEAAVAALQRATTGGC